jgi:hypothetical protein
MDFVKQNESILSNFNINFADDAKVDPFEQNKNISRSGSAFVDPFEQNKNISRSGSAFVDPFEQNKGISRSGSAFVDPFAVNNFNNGFVQMGNDMFSQNTSNNISPNKDIYFNNNNQQNTMFNPIQPINNIGNMGYQPLINNTPSFIPINDIEVSKNIYNAQPLINTKSSFSEVVIRSEPETKQQENDENNEFKVKFIYIEKNN